MIYLFILGIAALGTALYLLIMYSSIPGAVDERFGKLEAMPENLDRWIVEDCDETRQAASSGLKRETRTLYSPAKGLFGRDKFVRQVRYRDLHTNEILRVDPEEQVLRKRHKA